MVYVNVDIVIVDGIGLVGNVICVNFVVNYFNGRRVWFMRSDLGGG